MLFIMDRRGLTVLIFVLFLISDLAAGPVVPAFASSMGQEQKYAAKHPPNSAGEGMAFTSEELDAVLNELPLDMSNWTMHIGYEPMDYLYFSLMGDGDWSDWREFIKSDSKVIPLASARRVLYMVSTGFMDKRPLSMPLSQGWEEPEKAKAYIDVLRRMYYRPDPRQMGYLRLDAPKPQRSRWTLVGFLTQKEGLFSGRPWSWENFLPRIFTVSGMLIGGLLGVEFLRFIVRTGLRLGGRRRDDAAGARR
jgi:hypothetical protein